MAPSPFTDPVQAVLDESIDRVNKARGLPPLTTQAEPAPADVPDFDGLSRRYDLPVNVLMALGEGGDQDLDGAARALRGGLNRGLDIGSALAEGLGDPARSSAVLERAYQIADDQFPVQRDVPSADVAPAKGGLLSDTGNLLWSGVNSAAENMQELIGRVPTVGPAIVAAVDRADRWMNGGKGTQEIFSDTRKSVENSLSPEMLAATTKDWVTEGPDGYGFGPAWSDPRSYISGVVQSLPEMAVTMGVAGRLAKGAYAAALGRGMSQAAAGRAAATTATVAGGIMEGGLGGAASARSVRDKISGMSRDDLASSDALKAMMADGMSFEDARSALAENAASQAFVTAGIATGIFGGMGDRALAKIITDGAGGGIVKSAVKGAVGEGILEEMPQSAGQQLAENAAMRQADPSQSLTEGVANQAVGGAVLGGIMGGGLGAIAPSARPEPVTRPVNVIGQNDVVAPADAPEAPVPPPEPIGPLERAMNAGQQELDAAVRRNSPLKGQRVTLTDEFGTMSGTVADEGDFGILFQADDGQTFEYGRADLEGGAVNLAPVAVADAARADGPPDQAALDEQDQFDERAGILEFDEGLTRAEAERVAREGPGAAASLMRDYGLTRADADYVLQEQQKDVDAGRSPRRVEDILIDPEFDEDLPGVNFVPDREEVAPVATPAEPAPAPLAPARGEPVARQPVSAPAPYWDAAPEEMRVAIAKANGWGRAHSERMARLPFAELHPGAQKKIAGSIAQQTGITQKPVPLDGEILPPARQAREGQSRRAPPVIEGEVVQADAAAHEAATSPRNDLPEPTQAQKEAGNYRLGHLKISGLDVSVENPEGSERKGVDRDGKPWSVRMKSHYGYIRGTIGKDKDRLDVFVRPGTTDLSEDAPVYVVNQIEPTTGRFDEHKILIGYRDRGQAERAYRENYTKDWAGLGSIVRLTAPQFRAWLKDGDTKKPLALPAPKSTESDNGVRGRNERGEGPAPVVADGVGQPAGAPGNADRVALGAGADPGAAEARGRNHLPDQRPAADAKPALKAGQFRDGRVGDKLSAGERVLTATGRPTAPFPKVDTSTDRRARNTLTRVDEWLMDNAADEAKARGDEMNERIFRTNRQKPSQADKDAAEAYLFDREFVQPRPAPITKPLGTQVSKMQRAGAIEDGKPVSETKREATANEPRELDSGREDALAGASAEPVSGDGAGRQAGRDAARGGRADTSRNERARSIRPDNERGVGARARGISVPSAREASAPDDLFGRDELRVGDVAGRSRGNAEGAERQRLKPASGTPSGDLPVDFAISEDDEIGAGGAKTKFRNNIAAIRLLRQLEQEGRAATRKEQATLAKFVGWGGLQAAFGRSDGSVAKGWDKEAADLRELLSESEYQAAAASTRNAHYTSPEIVAAMWEAVRHLGFQSGRVLEPSLGVGNFFGLMPKDMRAASALHGVELDPITGGIAKHLYPGADIVAPMGFQSYSVPDGTFDAVIGNPPFGSETLYDPKRKDLSKFSIHNYFFAKSIDGLKPGGVLAMVVTNRMMDTAGGKARDYIAERADLIGAIRLPNNAFAKNAGTEVTTDIIFLRRREPGAAPSGETWLSIREHTDKSGKVVPLNEYFVRHPENMLGEFGAFGTMYRPDDPALVAHSGQDTDALLRAAIARLPKGSVASGAGKPAKELLRSRVTVDNVRIGSMFLDGDAVMVREDDLLGRPQARPVAFDSTRSRERVVGMIGIRDALNELRRAQLSPRMLEPQIEAARRTLNGVYDAFIKVNGIINVDANKRLFRDDPTWPQISALEEDVEKAITPATARKTGEKSRPARAKKAAIFSRRTQAPYAPPTKAQTAKDALVATLAETGRVDLPMMARLYGKPEATVLEELGDLVFNDPQRGWVTSEEYLAGNVKAKLAQAVDAARDRPELERNVEALRRVQPADIEAVDIVVKAGAGWLPKGVVADFVQHITGAKTASASYNPASAKWAISFAPPTREASTRWATGRADISSVLSAALSQSQITVRDRIDENTTEVNQQETDAANEKVKAVAAEWSDWVWQDDARRGELSRLYNDLFNTDVRRAFDGSHLTFPGKVGDDIIRLRPHQVNAVWRALQSDTALFDHVVGAGKTFTAIATAMEMRRMGMARKPMFVVPNHLVGQWAKDFLTLYPGANVLAATKRDFEAENRKRLFSRIATGDWDAVIVAHSSFGRVEVEPEAQAEFIDAQVRDLVQSIELMREAEGQRASSVKDLQKRITTLQERQKKLLDAGRKDDAIYWGELGVDALFVDEAHEFKNLAYSTSMQRVAGLGDKNGSQKASDLFLKSRQVLKATGGRNLVFMTGTPISNTMAEMYTMQRYLDSAALAAQGVAHFDAWARQFGEVVTDWELSPAGKYKLNSRFAKFVNMPELMQRYGSFSDVVTRDDIRRQLAAQGKRLPIPGVKGGRPVNVVVERSPAQAAFIGAPLKDEDGNETDQYPKGSLIWRAENLPKGKAKKGDDNMLVIMSEARKAALDMRILSPGHGDHAGSKVNVAADKIMEIYSRWEQDKGTQLVFIDLSTPKSAKATEKARIEDLVRRADAGDEAAAEELDGISVDEIEALNAVFSVYDDLREKLIARGIPAAEVAFIHDAKTDLQKEELFAKVRTGRVRVLLGSTSKMGAGTNVQNRLVALHHMDAPWRPSDLEQREGRIIRQGNDLFERDPDGFEVEIFRYATKETLDSRMWQTIEAKARFIEQVRKGSLTDRVVEDVAGEATNAAEMKAASSGNPLILEEMTLRQQVRKLESERTAFQREQFRVRDSIRAAERNIAFFKRRAGEMWLDAKVVQPDPFAMTVGGNTFDKRQEAGDALMRRVNALAEAGATGDHDIGAYGGFALKVFFDKQDPKKFSFVLAATGEYETEILKLTNAPLGAVLRIENLVGNLEGRAEAAEARVAQEERSLKSLHGQIKDSWSKEGEFETAGKRHGEVINALRPKKKDKTTEPDNSDNRYSVAHREPVSTLTGNELGEWTDMRDLGNKVRDWYRANLVSTTVTNRDTGWTIEFNNVGADKVYGRKGDVLMRIVPALRAIIENGRLISSGADNRGRKDIVAVHKFGATVILSGEPRDVIVTIRETQDGKFHYDLSRDMSEGARFGLQNEWVGGARILPDDGSGGVPAVRMPERQVRSPALEGLSADATLSNGGADLNLDFAQTTASTRATDGFSKASEADAHLRAGNLGSTIGRLINAGRVVIHDDASTLPGAGHPEGAIQGMTADNGTIHLVAANLTRETAPAVLLHEAFHSGVRPLLGDVVWTRTLERIRVAAQAAMDRADASMRGPSATFWEAALTSATVANTPLPHLSEEIAAYAIEHREQAPADVRDMVDRLIGSVKAWLLRRFGIQAGGVTPAELRALAVAALKDWDADVSPTDPDGGGTRYSMRMPSVPSKDRLFERARQALTAAMVGAKGSDKDRGRFSALGLVPTRPLFLELAKDLKSAKTYIDLKMSMDTLRNEWHALAADSVQEWVKFARKNKAANEELMDIMHASTLAEVDPSKPFESLMTHGDWYQLRNFNPETEKYQALLEKEAEDKVRKKVHTDLTKRFAVLPAEAKTIFKTVRDHYRKLADATEAQVLANVQEALQKIVKNAERTHEREMQRIVDEGLTGKAREDAIEAADRRLKYARARTSRNRAARLRSMRAEFERNRLKGAYFPLARFGHYFVTLRDDTGKVVSFSRFESLRKQEAFIAEMRKSEPSLKVEHGILDAKTNYSGMVDPKFVSEVEAILEGANAPEALRDEVWQAYLQSLPDLSTRKNRIHRKGTAGFEKDAIRAFAHQLFHGSHQLARLTYGLKLQDAIDEMGEQAQKARDPVRAKAVANEIKWRHDFIMNPSQAPWSHWMTSAAFVWTMGANLSSALVNIDQTFTKGIPWIAADKDLKPGVKRTTAAILQAMRDFTVGHGWTEKSTRLTADERAAMRAGYENGLIDRTQAHDVAGVAETGVAYSARRDRIMRFLSWPMHHTERFNREVTYLASYRLARQKGMGHGEAIKKASDLTWFTHFDNQNTSKPRFMQGDWGRVVFAMKAFQANILYRIFRDLHQAVQGESPEVQREARGRVAGTFIATLLAAGIRGSIAYGLVMTLASLVMGAMGDEDDPEEALRKWVLEHTGDTVIGQAVGGMMMDGIPGYLTGTSLSGRIGMADLWFRSNDRDLEGADAFLNIVGNVLGVPFGLAQSVHGGYESIADGQVWRGAEQMSPAALRNVMKGVRYAWEGALNRRGAQIVEDVPIADVIKQAVGFTPAQIAEQSRANNFAYNMQTRIREEKSGLLDALWAARGDPDQRAKVMSDIQAFNTRHPGARITPSGVNQSMRGRERYLNNAVGGANIDKGIRPEIEGKLAPSIY